MEIVVQEVRLSGRFGGPTFRSDEKHGLRRPLGPEALGAGESESELKIGTLFVAPAFRRALRNQAVARLKAGAT
jgi:hypothetical protein